MYFVVFVCIVWWLRFMVFNVCLRYLLFLPCFIVRWLLGSFCVFNCVSIYNPVGGQSCYKVFELWKTLWEASLETSILGLSAEFGLASFSMRQLWSWEAILKCYSGNRQIWVRKILSGIITALSPSTGPYVKTFGKCLKKVPGHSQGGALKILKKMFRGFTRGAPYKWQKNIKKL